MNFLIFPGASDPFHSISKDSTNLLLEYAAAMEGINKMECITYPGHSSFNGSTDKELEIISTKQKMIETLLKFESFNEDYIVFVRSYGCNPFLDILANANIELEHLKKSIIWGASAFHIIYEGVTEMFYHFYEEGLKRGVRISKNIFSNTYPVENYVQKKLKFNTVFCTGDQDKYSPLTFYQYLESINRNPNNRFPNLIKGEKHMVVSHNENYRKLILS